VANISRQELKSDEFVSGVDAAFEFYLQHQKQILTILVIVVVVVASAYGVYAWNHSRTQKAEAALSTGLDRLHAPILAKGQTAPPGVETFASAQDRARAAQEQFEKVIADYGSTRAGKIARYYLGLTQVELQQTSQAESTLQQASQSGGAVQPLAQNALANLYISEGKAEQARPILEALIKQNSPAVPKAVAMTELAEMEKTSDPAAAARLYQQLSQDYPNTPTGQQAEQALASLPKPAR